MIELETNNTVIAYDSLVHLDDTTGHGQPRAQPYVHGAWLFDASESRPLVAKGAIVLLIGQPFAHFVPSLQGRLRTVSQFRMEV
jgi:hypothetical protein